MVEHDSLGFDALFHALGDATRRRMIGMLSGGGRTVSQLAEPHAMSLAAASKHVRVLERAGLIRREIKGRVHLCRLDPAPLRAADAWLRTYEHFWNDRLDQLERALREDNPPSAQGDD